MSLGTNPRIWFVVIAAVLAGAAFSVSPAAAQPDPAGTWVAKVMGPQGEIEVTLVLEKSDDDWTGSLKGQNRTTELEKLVVIEGNVQFQTTNKELNITAKFDGTVDASGNRLVMTTSVPNMPAQELNFIRQIDELVTETGGKKYRVGSGPAGVWVGKVRAPDGEDSQVTLNLDKTNGEWFASIEDPFVNSVSGENVKVTDTMISFTFRPQGAPFPSHFSGTYIAADDRVSGSFSQRGSSRFVKFERDPSTVTLGLGPDGLPIQPPRIRHPYKFAATGRLSYWAALHVVKDETYNINTLTTSALNYDGALKYFVMDGFNVFLRGFRGGQNFNADEAQLANFEGIGLTSDSYLKLDGFEFGMTGYLGNLVTPNSSFNPFLTFAVGKASWELTASGRGSDILALDDEEFSGSDLSFAGGLGTEYELGTNLCLEFEFLWRYFLTEDTVRWANNDEFWSNTHAWALSAGVTYGFF
jgi:hypothetical protein